MTKIQKERVAKLIAALRSGEYKQARLRLRDRDKFCCLGVACEVYRQETGKGRWSNDADGDEVFHLGIRTETSELPATVAKWYGFPESDPVIAPSLIATRAAARNDNGESFATIADRFETVFLS